MKSLVEACLAASKEKQDIIEETNNLSIADQLVEEILEVYSKNPAAKTLPK